MEQRISLERFLDRWRIFWEGLWQGRRSIAKLPQSVGSDEPLARFLIQSKGYFSAENNRVKRRAFMPNPKDNETSVYRVQGLSEIAVWEIGSARVAEPLGRTLYGHAEVLASEVASVGLTTRADAFPVRHASIVGWPADESEQLSFAQELAEVATLRLRVR